GSLWAVLAVRLTIIALGVAFAAPYHAWTLEQVPPQHRYTILSLGNALGSQLIGAPASAVCLWCYKQTNSSLAPGVYLMILAAFAAFAVRRSRKGRLSAQTPPKKLISEIAFPN
ncbi:MAG: hypothetical protein V4487_05340, partial [Chlamydiota bacterium]